MNHNVHVTNILKCNSVTWYNNTVTNKMIWYGIRYYNSVYAMFYSICVC